MTGRGRSRLPTPEDRALWDSVTKTVAPLTPRSGVVAVDSTPRPPSTRERAPVGKALPATRTTEPPRLTPLDRRLRARIAKGSVAIDARIDLHGLTQAPAHHRLRSFLSESQAAGGRLVLVITGKGRPGDTHATGGERGVLRRLVPIWLASAELRPYVIGFEAAGRSHGGEGALYVRIRSRRKSG